MMFDIIRIFAIFGITFALKEIDGPLNIFSKVRNHLMTQSFAKVFFYKLFSCSFCLGSHSGWFVYLLSTPFVSWNIFEFVIWMFAGAAISLILTAIVEKLYYYQGEE